MTVALKLDVKSNIKQFTKGLNKVGKSQIPFTTNIAIRNTAFKLREITINDMDKYIDRPTALTKKKGVFVEVPKKNKKATPIGFVYFTQLVSSYLKWGIYGGSRPHKSGRVLPTRNISLNKFGNVINHRNIISTFRKKKNHFINSTGIFKRNKTGKATALYIFEKRAVPYKKTFPFFEIMIKRSGNIFDYNFKRTLQFTVDREQSLINKGIR